MFDAHLSGNGDMVRIYQMTDTHLINLINFRFREIEKFRQEFQHDRQLPDPIAAALFSDGPNADAAARRIRECIVYLQPYVMELFYRVGSSDSPQITPQLVASMARNLRVLVQRRGALPVPVEPDTGEYEDEDEDYYSNEYYDSDRYQPPF